MRGEDCSRRQVHYHSIRVADLNNGGKVANNPPHGTPEAGQQRERSKD